MLSYNICSLILQTDPKNTDYECEHGATRNFQAQKFAEQEEELLKQQREEEEMNNPMKVSFIYFSSINLL